MEKNRSPIIKTMKDALKILNDVDLALTHFSIRSVKGLQKPVVFVFIDFPRVSHRKCAGGI